MRDAAGAARNAAAEAAAWVAAAPRIDEAAAGSAYAGARTYSGVLRCAGCPARRLTLTVFSDGTFRTFEADRDGIDMRVVSDNGRWSVPANASGTIVLRGFTTGTRVLRRVLPDGLEWVDVEGRATRPPGEVVLSRVPRVDPLSGPLRLAGTYLREDRRAVFVECLTGRRVPVVEAAPASGARTAVRRLAAARAALDDAQRQIGDGSGDPVLAVVRGYLVPHSGSPHDVGSEALVVVGFERATRGGHCEDVVRRTP